MDLFRRHISLVHALGLLGNRHPEEPLVYKRLDDCGHSVVPGFLCEGDEVGAGLRGCAVPDDRLGDLGVRGLSRVGRVVRLVAGAVVECDLEHAVRDAENGGGECGVLESLEYCRNAGFLRGCQVISLIFATKSRYIPTKITFLTT